MISDSGEDVEETASEDTKTLPVLPSLTALFILFMSVVLIALTVAPRLMGQYTPIEVYTYIVRLTALWAGLVWLSASLYISLITGAREFSIEIWLAFVVGALMSYLGIAGDFVNTPYWLGVRSIMYTFISLIAVSLIINVQHRLGENRPTVTLVELLRRARRQRDR